jgi:hypothetical protein
MEEALYGKDMPFSSRSTSAASNPTTNQTFWRESHPTMEPLEFHHGPIDGSGRLSTLSFSAMFKSQAMQTTTPDWPLRAERPCPSEPQGEEPSNWTAALFPMPRPIKMRTGKSLYEQPASAASQKTLALPDNLGKLNSWLRENRRRENF